MRPYVTGLADCATATQGNLRCENSYKLCTRYGISWWLFGLFWFIILARNIDCKSILQKTLNQIGLVDSKFERKSRYKSNFQCVSLRRRVCFNMSPHMILQSAFQFGFLLSKPCLFRLESSLEFLINRGKLASRSRKIRLKSKWNTSCRVVPPYPKGRLCRSYTHISRSLAGYQAKERLLTVKPHLDSVMQTWIFFHWRCKLESIKILQG